MTEVWQWWRKMQADNTWKGWSFFAVWLTALILIFIWLW